MKHYQSPNTQFVRLSSGEVMDANMGGLSIASGGGGIQGTAMAPRLEKRQ
ncbi:MAG: hypothetical protein MJZ58_02340 [Paludibacteraceae bacterium]|nr:hypothetical protein [Paludibacteraceae bacterium]